MYMRTQFWKIAPRLEKRILGQVISDRPVSAEPIKYPPQAGMSPTYNFFVRVFLPRQRQQNESWLVVPLQERSPYFAICHRYWLLGDARRNNQNALANSPRPIMPQSGSSRRDA